MMIANYPINPRVRAYGKARIDIAQRARDAADWERMWKQPLNTFPFTWGEEWKQCVEYKVDDFAAEVGFYIDVLGLPVNAFSPDYAMFTSPGADFYLSVIPTPPGELATPPDAIHLQYMVSDLFATTQELERRGIAFEQPPRPIQPGSSLFIASFRTPHGICTDLWGMVAEAFPDNLVTAPSEAWVEENPAQLPASVEIPPENQASHQLVLPDDDLQGEDHPVKNLSGSDQDDDDDYRQDETDEDLGDDELEEDGLEGSPGEDEEGVDEGGDDPGDEDYLGDDEDDLDAAEDDYEDDEDLDEDLDDDLDDDLEEYPEPPYDDGDDPDETGE